MTSPPAPRDPLPQMASLDMAQRVLRFMERYGLIVAFASLFLWNAVFAENAETFRNPANLRNIFNQNAATGIVAVGMTFVIVAGGIDLSVGSVMALAGAAAVWLLNWFLAAGLPEPWAVLCAGSIAIGVGVACGFLNGTLVTFGRLPAFIATLGGLSIYRSITLAIAEGGELRANAGEVLQGIARGGIPLLPERKLPDGGTTAPLIIYWGIIAFVAIAALADLVLTRSRFGRHVVAVGGNELAARYSAVPVNRTRLTTYVLVGALSAIAGLLVTARGSSMSSSQLGLLMELDAIAAVVIGGTSMTGGRGRVWGTVLGVLILAIINNMLVVYQVSPYWQGSVKGAIIVLAVLIQRGRR